MNQREFGSYVKRTIRLDHWYVSSKYKKENYKEIHVS